MTTWLGREQFGLDLKYHDTGVGEQIGLDLKYHDTGVGEQFGLDLEYYDTWGWVEVKWGFYHITLVIVFKCLM